MKNDAPATGFPSHLTTRPEIVPGASGSVAPARRQINRTTQRYRRSRQMNFADRFTALLAPAQSALSDASLDGDEPGTLQRDLFRKLTLCGTCRGNGDEADARPLQQTLWASSPPVTS